MGSDSFALDDPRRLAAIGAAGLLHAELDEAFGRVVRLASEILEAPVALASVVDAERVVTLGRHSPTDWPTYRESSVNDSLCTAVVASGEPLRIEDAALVPGVHRKTLFSERGVRAYLGVPIGAGDGLTVGVLSVADFEPRRWSEDQVARLVDLAAVLTSEIALRTEVRAHQQTVDALQLAKEEALRANRAKAEFVSRISHELRTPMNAILGFAQVLEMDLANERDRESVEHILRAGRHLLALIDEVLDIARIESGRLELGIEPVPVNELLDEVLALTRYAAAAKEIELVVRPAPDTERFVWADPRRLKEVMLNLLSNAIQYNRQGGRVTVSQEDVASGALRVSVRDTGMGIPADKFERLFTPFERLGAERAGVAGTGLGLVLSRALITAMDGTLGIESVEGEGSHFWIELPQPDSRQRELLNRPSLPAEIPTTHALATVLLIEDNLANARLIGHILERRGRVRLLTARQGRRGIELSRECRPDLVILDVNLPDVSGEAVLRHFREEPRLRDVPVVMISGGADEAQIDELLAIGADAFLRKPFEVHQLLQVVDEHLQASEG